jgi:hypothetical protein
MFPRPDILVDYPGDTSRGDVYSDIAIPTEEICDSRRSDPFFRCIDAALRQEREIRAVALRTLEILFDVKTAWTIGGPGAQLVEWKSALRVLGESYERTMAEIESMETV